MQTQKTPARILKPNELTDLTRRVALLFEAFMRRPSDELLRIWVEELAPFYGETLCGVLRAAVTKERSPNLGEILDDLKKARAKEKRERESAARFAEQERLNAEWKEMSPEQQAEKDRIANEFFARMRRVLGVMEP